MHMFMLFHFLNLRKIELKYFFFNAVTPNSTTENPYLLSSLYHSKSGLGTAIALHCRAADRPTGISAFFDSIMTGGSKKKKTHI